MRKTLILLMICISCRKQHVITSKSVFALQMHYLSEDYARLPNGICEFNVYNHASFQDSCNKYSIGDTIR